MSGLMEEASRCDIQLQTRWCHKRHEPEHEPEHEPWTVNINEKRLNSIRVALTPSTVPASASYAGRGLFIVDVGGRLL